MRTWSISARDRARPDVAEAGPLRARNGRTPGELGPAPGVPVPGLLRVGRGEGSRERLEAGSSSDSLTRCGFGFVGPFGRAPRLLRRPRSWDFHLCSISARSPKTTARAALSSSKSISNSPKVRVSGWPQNVPIASARSKSGRRRTWRSSARAAGGRVRTRPRRRRTSSRSVESRTRAGWRGWTAGPFGVRRRWVGALRVSPMAGIGSSPGCVRPSVPSRGPACRPSGSGSPPRPWRR
jgi:hypothetical protein